MRLARKLTPCLCIRQNGHHAVRGIAEPRCRGESFRGSAGTRDEHIDPATPPADPHFGHQDVLVCES
jgi:hypothetical protein